MLLENNPYPADVRVRNEATSLRDAGYAVTVVAPRRRGQAARERVEGVTVRRFRLPRDRHSVGGFVLEYLVAAVQLHARGALELLRGARVLHLHNPPDLLFPIAFVGRLAGRQVVFDHHDLAPELAADKFGDSPLVGLLRLCEWLTFRAASAVLCTNESYRAIAVGRGRVREDRVTIVRNGPRAAVAGEPAAARPGVLDDPRLAFLGELEPQDGVDRLAELMRELRDAHGLAARLTVIGAGSRRAPLEQAMRRLGLQDRARFTGHVPHAQVFELLGEADVCVDPAPCNPLNHQSTMTKIAEYLAAGRPVVAHRLVETERTAGDAAVYASCGDVAELARLVAELARDPDRRLELGLRARRRSPELAWERSAAALEAAYRGLSGA